MKPIFQQIYHKFFRFVVAWFISRIFSAIIEMQIAITIRRIAWAVSYKPPIFAIVHIRAKIHHGKTSNSIVWMQRIQIEFLPITGSSLPTKWFCNRKDAIKIEITQHTAPTKSTGPYGKAHFTISRWLPLNKQNHRYNIATQQTNILFCLIFSRLIL